MKTTMRSPRPPHWPLALVSALLPAALFSADRSLATRIEEVTGDERYKTAHWGLLIVEQASGRVLYEQNADKLFAPASTTKLYSVATALDAFGPDHCFETVVCRQGPVSGEGVLEGDLVLVAGGDLTLGGRTDAAGRIAFNDVDHSYANFTVCRGWTAPDPLAGLDELARQTAAAGVKRVAGDVVVDDRLFEKTDSTGSGPSTTTPIMVNDNLIDFLITPAAAGAPAIVEWRPKSAVVPVDAQVATVPAGRDPDLRLTEAAHGGMVLRGSIACDSPPLLRIGEVGDPAGFARGLFIEALRRAGIAVEASPLAGNNPAVLPRPASYDAGQRLAVLKSPPFREEARLILKVSHNLHASALPLLVAVKHGQRSLADGLRQQHDFLQRAGIDVTTISFAGGAGGGTSDFTTPRATVQLLRHMVSRPDFAAYEAALPILGVDGTLTTAVPPESPARGQVRAKTGTLVWENTMNGTFLLTSKALAGYLTTATGQKRVLTLMVNNVPIAKSSDTAVVGKALGRLCEIVCDDRTAP